MAVTPHQHIARANAALARGARAEALDHLVAAWVLCPCPRLGDLAEALGQRLIDHADIIDARRSVGHAAWMKCAREPDRVTLGTLLVNFVEGPAADVGARIDAIATWPDDPRTSRAIVRALKAGAWPGPAYARIRPRIAELLTALADPAVLPDLHSLPGRGWYGAFRPLVAGIVAATQVRWPTVDTDLPGLDAIADALTGAGPATAVLADLLAQVYAALDDDRPRLVYADAVASTDPARAEFIVLQHQARLSRVQRARMNELRAAHEQRWLGKLAPVIRKAAWRRGFVHDVVVRRPASATLHGFIGDPAWRTVEHVRFARHMADFEIPYELLFDNLPLRGVRSAHGFTGDALRRLAALDGPWSLTTVGVHGYPPPIVPTGGLAKVTHLDIEFERYRLLRASELMRSRVGDPFMQKLTSMTCPAEYPFEVSTLYDYAALHEYQELVTWAQGWEYRFADRLQRATLRKRGRQPDPAAFSAAVDRLPDPVASQLRAQFGARQAI